jgi:hypothetical protein
LIVSIKTSARSRGKTVMCTAFGGYAGDCGIYHPQVVSVPVTGVTQDHIYNPRPDAGASIWGPSGIAIDGSGTFTSLPAMGRTAATDPAYFLATALMGLQQRHPRSAPRLSQPPSAPDNATQSWCALAATDLDIGSPGPTLAATRSSRRGSQVTTGS